MLLVTLRDLDWDTAFEIIGDGRSEADFNRAESALIEGAQACVLCCAVDEGEIQYSYFDIVLANGMQFDAVSARHLDGISEWVAS